MERIPAYSKVLIMRCHLVSKSNDGMHVPAARTDNRISQYLNQGERDNSTYDKNRKKSQQFRYATSSTFH